MAELHSKSSAACLDQDDGSEPLRSPILISVVCHIALIGGSIAGAIITHNTLLWGESTGGANAATSVRLVSAASIPLPAPTVVNDNKLANDNPGLHYAEAPKPEPVPTPEKAIELPGRGARKKPPPPAPPKPRQEARLHKPDRVLPPTNEIPYGAGGPAQGPYGMFQSDAGTGGFAFAESAGDFGTRFGWYVTAIRSRISSNWLQGTIDPSIRSAPRVYVTFEILRDGQVVNAQITSSSGVPSLDRSALRAVADSNPMPPLPGDYRNSSVAVEFWFDLRR